MIICSGLLIFLIDKEHKTSCSHFVKSGLVNRCHLRTIFVHFEKEECGFNKFEYSILLFRLINNWELRKHTIKVFLKV